MLEAVKTLLKRREILFYQRIIFKAGWKASRAVQTMLRNTMLRFRIFYTGN